MPHARPQTWGIGANCSVPIPIFTLPREILVTCLAYRRSDDNYRWDLMMKQLQSFLNGSMPLVLNTEPIVDYQYAYPEDLMKEVAELFL